MKNFVENQYINKYLTVSNITYDTLVSLHYDVLYCANEARRLEWCVLPARLICLSLYRVQVRDALFLDDVLQCQTAPDHCVHSTLEGGPADGLWASLKGRLQWQWHFRLHPVLGKALAVVLGVLAVVILASECTLGVAGEFDRALFSFYSLFLSGSYGQTMARDLD